jgi:hypothetical protein
MQLRAPCRVPIARCSTRERCRQTFHPGGRALLRSVLWGDWRCYGNTERSAGEFWKSTA